MWSSPYAKNHIFNSYYMFGCFNLDLPWGVDLFERYVLSRHWSTTYNSFGFSSTWIKESHEKPFLLITPIRKEKPRQINDGVCCAVIRSAKRIIISSIKNPLTSPKVSGLNLRFITNSLIHLYFSQNIIPLFHYDE